MILKKKNRKVCSLIGLKLTKKLKQKKKQETRKEI